MSTKQASDVIIELAQEIFARAVAQRITSGGATKTSFHSDAETAFLAAEEFAAVWTSR